MTASSPPPGWTREDFDRAALAHWASLHRLHKMQAPFQSRQRSITYQSMGALGRRRPQARVQCFSKLLVQQFHQGELVKVVPDTMVVLGECDQRDGIWYDPVEDPPLFMVIENIWQSHPYGDYAEKPQIYEEKLRVPYYLTYEREAAPRMICLYRHDGQRYQIVPANEEDRYPIPELELEVGLAGKWMRFWYRGVLLLLAEELASVLDTPPREHDPSYTWRGPP